MNITPASAMAAWAVFTAWLILFFVIDRFDKTPDQFDLVDWIQAIGAVVAVACYPALHKLFTRWLAAKSR